MGQLLIRGLEDDVIDRLKERAGENNRSLEAELREILVQASRQISRARARALADEIRSRIGPGPHSDSADLIREDRDR